MRIIFTLLISAFLISSCGSSRNFKTSEDNALAQAIKKLRKSPENAELKASIIQLHNDAVKLHLDKIEIYSSLTELDRFDKIIGELEALQSLHNSIRESDHARQLVQSKDYSAEIVAVKEQGALAWYERAEDELASNDRRSAKTAWYDFRKADKLVPGFRDVKQKMANAYESSIISVVINPVRNNSSYFNSGYNSRANYSQDNLQRQLVRELGGNYQATIPARFYTDYEAQREGIRPDWEVDLNWVDLDIPRPCTQTYSRNLNRQIQTGTDTSGKAIYQTASGTLTITKSSFSARGDMEVRITETDTRKNISYSRHNDSYNWEEEYATFRGDERALTSSNWQMINRNRNYNLRRDDIVEELYSRIYPQVKSRIYNTANW